MKLKETQVLQAVSRRYSTKRQKLFFQNSQKNIKRCSDAVLSYEIVPLSSIILLQHLRPPASEVTKVVFLT